MVTPKCDAPQVYCQSHTHCGSTGKLFTSGLSVVLQTSKLLFMTLTVFKTDLGKCSVMTMNPVDVQKPLESSVRDYHSCVLQNILLVGRRLQTTLEVDSCETDDRHQS